MASTRLICTLADSQRVTLVRPLIATDFVAGINLRSGSWHIIPSSNLLTYQEQRLLTELDYPINRVSIALTDYLKPLLGKPAIIEIAQRKISGVLKAVDVGYAHVVEPGAKATQFVNLSMASTIQFQLVDNFFEPRLSSGKVTSSVQSTSIATI